jgi:hypothetical protein
MRVQVYLSQRVLGAKEPSCMGILADQPTKWGSQANYHVRQVYEGRPKLGSSDEWGFLTFTIWLQILFFEAFDLQATVISNTTLELPAAVTYSLRQPYFSVWTTREIFSSSCDFRGDEMFELVKEMLSHPAFASYAAKTTLIATAIAILLCVSYLWLVPNPIMVIITIA